MRVGDWLDQQLVSMPASRREQIFALVEDREERQAIIDESREAELTRANDDRVTHGIREMYPDPARMRKDLRHGASANDRAIFASHLFQPSKTLDDAINKYAGRIVTADGCRSTFRRVLV